jgi:hypothetical protein
MFQMRHETMQIARGAAPKATRLQVLAGVICGRLRKLDRLTPDDIVKIQITLSQRTQAVKLAIYRAFAERLSENPGVRPEDVFVSLVPVTPED